MFSAGAVVDILERMPESFALVDTSKTHFNFESIMASGAASFHWSPITIFIITNIHSKSFCLGESGLFLSTTLVIPTGPTINIINH